MSCFRVRVAAFVFVCVSATFAMGATLDITFWKATCMGSGFADCQHCIAGKFADGTCAGPGLRCNLVKCLPDPLEENVCIQTGSTAATESCSRFPDATLPCAGGCTSYTCGCVSSGSCSLTGGQSCDCGTPGVGTPTGAYSINYRCH